MSEDTKLKIKLTDDQFLLFSELGQFVSTKEGEYWNFPFWIKKTDEENMYIILSEKDVPKGVKNIIKF